MVSYKFDKPVYDITKSWGYNYNKGPKFNGPYPLIINNKKWSFLGYNLISPLGIAAGPLPNAKWIVTYTKLGYSSLVQKTVRSKAHFSFKLPNIVYVKNPKKLDLDLSKPVIGSKFYKGSIEKLSITNSFGNPSKIPRVWIKEIKKAKKALNKNQLLGVSVYGTQSSNTTLKELANDYAITAKMAKDAGAMFIEANLACPNVLGFENPFLYKDSYSVEAVSSEIKSKIGNLPLVLKIGYFENFQNLLEVLKKAKDHFEAVAAINTIPKKVVDIKGRPILPGRDISGICGYAIKKYGIKMVKDLVRIRKLLKLSYEIIGVGGVMSPKDVVDYLNAGASHVHSATAIMWNPYLAYDFQQYLENKK